MLQHVHVHLVNTRLIWNEPEKQAWRKTYLQSFQNLFPTSPLFFRKVVCFILLGNANVGNVRIIKTHRACYSFSPKSIHFCFIKESFLLCRKSLSVSLHYTVAFSKGRILTKRLSKMFRARLLTFSFHAK